MEAKKNPKADLRRFTGLFFQIGLILAFWLVLGAFNYTVQERTSAVFGSLTDVIDDMELIPITRPAQVTPPPPPPAPKVAEVITIIEDADIEDDFIVEDVEATQETEVVLIERFEEAEVEEEVPFSTCEFPPQFPGGEAALVKYIESYVMYPEVAKENGIQGMVYVQFVINKMGEVENVGIARSVDASLDQEAIRVVRSLPKWTPGMQRGKPVRVSYTMPIYFKMY